VRGSGIVVDTNLQQLPSEKEEKKERYQVGKLKGYRVMETEHKSL
jgi:hypothetical protein